MIDVGPYISLNLQVKITKDSQKIPNLIKKIYLNSLWCFNYTLKIEFGFFSLK